jgi:hypothetical protein
MHKAKPKEITPDSKVSPLPSYWMRRVRMRSFFFSCLSIFFVSFSIPQAFSDYIDVIHVVVDCSSFPGGICPSGGPYTGGDLDPFGEVGDKKPSPPKPPTCPDPCPNGSCSKCFNCIAENLCAQEFCNGGATSNDCKFDTQNGDRCYIDKLSCKKL